ncbi:sensor histidine kinase [Paenibacillus sp. IB182496]|uniref:Sensor histidine kinase n=1 Tax=Paenibacillus sabuli TaxID=2772509 RepID=A0A927BVE8_9BACL|nr:sensor histidine kinase [Paenibacillus sabuli]MBD2846455.1 sensor histidine kinase [Paenibacillus sabuli]
MKALFRMANQMKLRTKLIFSFVIVVFAPVLVVGVLLGEELQSMALDNAAEQTRTNVERVRQRTLEVLHVSRDIAYRLANDERMAQVASERYTTTYAVVEAYRSYRDIEQYIRLYKEIANIRLYMDNPTLLNNWEFLQPTREIVRAGWYEQALQGPNDAVTWQYLQDERDGQFYLSLVRKVHFLDSAQSAVLVVNANMDLLGQILRQESFDTMLVDEAGAIVASNKPEQVGRTLRELELIEADDALGSGVHQAAIGGTPYQIRVAPLAPDASLGGLRIVSIFAIDAITGDITRTNGLALAVIGAALLAATVMIVTVSNLVTKRMRHLSKHINRVATGNLNTVVVMDGKDEIAQLSRQFNAMVASIHELVDAVGESNRQKRELEAKQSEIRFKMMASQINPHFLFNALESIRMKAHMRGEREIARIVRLLGKLIRRNLEADERMTTVGAELDLVRSYLQIQNFRYNDRLLFRLIAAPETMGLPIPPLVIQPLVENAVIHGLENDEQGARIEVHVRADATGLSVLVVDDGAGMDADRLHRLRWALRQPEEREPGGRIGLRNVDQRLKMTYGEPSGLRVHSAPGRGTRVRFRIPTGGMRRV